uniref:U31-Nephitoxin-Nsp1a_1 n=1 Tax=Nephila sp. SGP-2016 TaxID=1905176 RepID=A0A4Q8K5Z6_9ARAC
MKYFTLLTFVVLIAVASAEDARKAFELLGCKGIYDETNYVMLPESVTNAIIFTVKILCVLVCRQVLLNHLLHRLCGIHRAD